MSLDVRIVDPRNGKVATVARSGALAVGPSHTSLPFNAELAIDDTPVNIVPAVADTSFCITGIILTGNKNISATVDATVVIYVADDEVTATVRTEVLTIPVGKSSQIVINPILVEIEEGKWINGTTSDDDVFVTILGYYVKVER